MRRFTYLPHTADMRFRAYGADFRVALENAALALLNIMLDIKAISSDSGQKTRIKLEESADTTEELVWFTLQDMLSRVDTMKLSAYALHISKLSAANGRFKMAGYVLCKRTKADYSLLYVKAVTPNELFVRDEAGRRVIQVVVDV